MAAYKARRKRSAGLKAIGGMRVKGAAQKPAKSNAGFGTPSGAESPLAPGRYAPRSERNLIPGRARKRGGNRKLF